MPILGVYPTVDPYSTASIFIDSNNRLTPS